MAQISPFKLFSSIMNEADYYSIVEGKRYFLMGHISQLEFQNGKIQAKVRGAYPYKVTLSISPNGLPQSSCTCPSYRRPCKHIIAVLLAAQKRSAYFTFSTLAAEYLQIVEIKDDLVKLKIFEEKPAKKLADITGKIESKNKAHAFFRDIGQTVDFEKDALIVHKKGLIKIIKEHQGAFSEYYKALLSPSQKPLSIVQLDSKPTLKLYQKEDQNFSLEIKYKGDNFPLQPEKFLINYRKNKDFLSDSLINALSPIDLSLMRQEEDHFFADFDSEWED